ncbi:Glycogen phosphorylase [Usitatibacter rugosus]|uniref:glycogen phosphorylase n=1 Tax=Usitatibacter rugosus TaxID=2732067 RepID=A0A6M4GUM2_9PROT|nr:alpha-glucan family phosphorylase [Usitatibacter rugosus]QJR11031.1 Glycogen phosphorylase [Usitatibacter rugosus]
MRRGARRRVEVRPRLPQPLGRLEEIAGDLWYSWYRPARELFAEIDPVLWEAVSHSPRAFLRTVDESKLEHAASDTAFLEHMRSVLAAYDGYLGDARPRGAAAEWTRSAPVAYFCAEFGLHESFPMYSGGLGILAGDHCKAASDQRLPFVGVGLLYRQGYFTQRLDVEGAQQVEYHDADFEHLPITLLKREDGSEIRVPVSFPDRTLWLRLWEARVGHVRLVLMDSDFDENDEPDRDLTHRLYGGDRVHRLEQEIALGVGGARALEALGIQPAAWHINEGHAAFLIIERVRRIVAGGVPFAVALEAVAANVVFTTHTAVPAGHDRFEEAVIEGYFGGLCREMGIEPSTLLALGVSPDGPGFNMTALALRGSRSRNAVSRIHAQVTSKMLQGFWPEVDATENPIGYVTNGVHVPTFLASEWPPSAHELPDADFWSIHQRLKTRALKHIATRMRARHLRNQGSEPHLERLLRLVDFQRTDVLTIGFARRFATYKRAAMIFDDLDWARELLCDPKRPVLLLFAGKAHPADHPGQDVIRRIAEVAAMPDFEGKVLLLENYDLHLSRRLVAGVDVWLNNPVYPLEASGTSGMKAGMNGVLNLSVLDGWWGEGYEPGNGWAIRPAAPHLDAQARDREEARTLYELLQDHVIPLYYDRDGDGRSPGWIAMAKRSMATLLPKYDARRMLDEYIDHFYQSAAHAGERFAADGFAAARELSGWRSKVEGAWPGVEVRWVSALPPRVTLGDRARLEAEVRLNGLDPDDVRVEMLVERGDRGAPQPDRLSAFLRADPQPPHDGWQRYGLDYAPALCGGLSYSLRVYPFHRLLAHHFELGRTAWSST